MPENNEYKIYVIQHNNRSDGCNFSLADSPPACSKQDVVACFKAKRPAVGGFNIGASVRGQLDVMLKLLKQQFPDAEFEGTKEQGLLLEFAIKLLIKQRERKPLYLATCNTGDLKEEMGLPFCTA